MSSRESPGQPEHTPVPRHVAIIMDGNNRWARRQSLPGAAGHRAGVEAVRGVLRSCQQHGIEVLTLFAFSSENWGRPRPEVRALLALLSRYLRNEVRDLHKDGVRLRFMGERRRFSDRLQRLMANAEFLTRDNTVATVVLAVDYGGRWDITQASRQLAARVQAGEMTVEDIDEASLSRAMALGDLPAPDLCIRTGGDARISNFMLWQFAYSELYFTHTLWPDFGELEFARALSDYARRERRFGVRESDALASGAQDA